jgi:hypothetical protein
MPLASAEAAWEDSNSDGVAMEPTTLTCPKCAATWKLIKAGTGPITCPMCKAPLEGASASNPQPAPAADSAPPTPLPAAAVDPVIAGPAVESAFAGMGHLPHVQLVQDADDPGGLKADFDDEPRRRRGMHPLLKTLIILLILFILVPVAVFILLLVVCAVMIASK